MKTIDRIALPLFVVALVVSCGGRSVPDLPPPPPAQKVQHLRVDGVWYEPGTGVCHCRPPCTIRSPDAPFTCLVEFD